MILFLTSLIYHWLWPELEDPIIVETEPVRPAQRKELIGKSWVRTCSGRLQRGKFDNDGWVLCSQDPTIAHRRVIGEHHYGH